MLKFSLVMPAKQAVCAIVLAAALGAVLPARGSALSLFLERTIALPGVAGRIDHMDYDASRRRLYVAALGDDSVLVVSDAASSVIRRIRGLSEPQGIALVPETGRLYVASGGTGICDVFDTASLALREQVDLGGDADNIHYDPVLGSVFVSAGQSIRRLSAADGSPEASVELPGHVEGFALETTGPLLFANVPLGERSVYVIDRRSMKILHRWPAAGPLTNLFSNFPLGLDERDRRLFVATRHPPFLLVMDADSGSQVATVKIDGDADDVFYDRDRRLLYVSCGTGYLDVIAQEGPDSYVTADRIPTSVGARTSLWVPESRTLFVAAPRSGDTPARVLVFHSP